MKAFLFPGQGSQFVTMGADDATNSAEAQQLYTQADEILGFALSDVMFNGSDEDLKATRITQPAIFLHSYVRMKLLGEGFQPSAVAGHSLGEFTALAAIGAISFADGLRLVRERAEAMQSACDDQAGTMAAVVGLEDAIVEEICKDISPVVVPANYNSPGQLVISGTVEGVRIAGERLAEAGATKVIQLPVGGAFHSPLMASAKDRLSAAISATQFHAPICQIYQNVDAQPTKDPDVIKEHLIAQLTAPVRWTQTMQNMIANGIGSFTEVGGKGRILCGLLRRISRDVEAQSV